MIRVVDIFAGAGGLGEGFSAAQDHKGNHVFDVVLSIEMNPCAFETLLLRAFFHQFPEGAPDDYYRHLRGEITRAALYEVYSLEARRAAERCWQARLGPEGQSARVVRERLDAVVGKMESWVLLGGPPCQAYSLAGRSRNQANPDYDASKDVRQQLYVEYLQILADHRPTVFVLENVKGLLSATRENVQMFQRILDDLRDPASALAREGRPSRHGKHGNYRVYSLTEPRLLESGDFEGVVVKSERYGIPQARHRIVLLGVRDDLEDITPLTLLPKPSASVSSAIDTLPRLRSGLSRRSDSPEAWEKCLRSQVDSRWANAGTCKADSIELSKRIRKVLLHIKSPSAGRGGEFVRGDVSTSPNSESWYTDKRIGGVCNHNARGHMDADLYRYLYAACYADLRDVSPSLQHFPTDLLPDHVNVGEAIATGGHFSDRFRVQVANRPSTTIVSHISKDGHYYIHPDPTQCRSLTVREAARLQTFPDNYLFCGPRTSQYVQVGNAVPPMLSNKIAMIVLDVLRQAGANG